MLRQGLTFPEHLRGDFIKFGLEFIEQVVHSCGELALGIGVLRAFSKSNKWASELAEGIYRLG